MKKLEQIVILLTVAQIMSAGQRTASIAVSALVRPVARIEVSSATLITVRLTPYPKAEGLVWTAVNSCLQPENPRVLPNPGIYQIIFAPEEVQGKSLVCLVTTDGVLSTSARLPGTGQ